MFENPRRGRQAKNFTINAPKILDLQSFFRTDTFRKTDVGCPDCWLIYNTNVVEGLSRLDVVNNTTSPEDIKKKNLILLKTYPLFCESFVMKF